MKIICSPHEIRREVLEARKEGRTIGFVPTMGALHAGHMSLVTQSKNRTDLTVMSVFVNPLQFAPNEDFTQYPRPIEKDIDLAHKGGVDFFFSPSVEEMYPVPQTFIIDEKQMSGIMCGKYRPGHFQGVATVILKLLNCIPADLLFLGRKDGQQLRIIQALLENFNHMTEVVGCETLREKDGLAFSSRNVYLSGEERKIAPLLYLALKRAKQTFVAGESSVESLLKVAQDTIKAEPGIRLEYLELRRWRDLTEIAVVNEKSILALAAYLGKTRLIDNVILER